MAKPRQLSALQIAILRVLWQRGEATVAQVQEALLAERGLAHTTVATLLMRLAKRGLVARSPQGRSFVYRALVEESDIRRSMVSALTEGLFGGDPSALVHHLIDEGDLDKEELARLRKLLAARQRTRAKRRPRGGRDAR